MPSGVPTRAVATAFLRPTIRLRISPSMARALQRHAQAVAAWRFSVSVSRDTLASGDKAQGFLCVVKSVPIVEGVKLSANDLLEFVDSLRGGTGRFSWRVGLLLFHFPSPRCCRLRAVSCPQCGESHSRFKSMPRLNYVWRLLVQVFVRTAGASARHMPFSVSVCARASNCHPYDTMDAAQVAQV